MKSTDITSGDIVIENPKKNKCRKKTKSEYYDRGR